MKAQRLALAIFSAAILFSMVREWNAPVECTRSTFIPTASANRNSN